ncbi:MAG: hypothetical protein Q9172_000718 [Xanthocarpia lactea]
MYPSFTGSARRPRQVNLSGRNTNPFASAATSKQSSSTQTTQHTLAHAHAERLQRYQERLRPPAARSIQRAWRGYRSRRQTTHVWRQEWDVKELADAAAEGREAPGIWDPTPYQSEQDCLDQLRLLVHFASPREPSDGDRVILFARRYASSAWPTRSAAASNAWTCLLLRLAKLAVSMLEPFKSRNHGDLNVILELLSAVVTIIPKQMASFSIQYFEALRGVASDSQGVYNLQVHHQEQWEEAIRALLRPVIPNATAAYEGFASQILRIARISQDTLQRMSDSIRVRDLVLAMRNSLSTTSPNNLLHSMSREELLWLVAYFIYFYRTGNSTQEGTSDTLYVSVMSKFISYLAADIASRIDGPTYTASTHNDDSTSASAESLPSLPNFLRNEILGLISQEHVSGLLARAGPRVGPGSETSAVKPEQASELAVYALTLLRAFPSKGDEIRMWLYFGSTSRKDSTVESSMPAMKYYYKAANQTSIYKLISRHPNHVISLLNPSIRRRTNALALPDRDEQWQVILLFLELYPIGLKVMDDEDFLNGANSSENTNSWTRRSALDLDQVKDLTIFLKNLAFSMYWNGPEIAGVEESDNKSSIAAYFSGDVAALSDNHPDGRSVRVNDATIAGLPWITLSYLKGMSTGLLRMIYERE